MLVTYDGDSDIFDRVHSKLRDVFCTHLEWKRNTEKIVFDVKLDIVSSSRLQESENALFCIYLAKIFEGEILVKKDDFFSWLNLMKKRGGCNWVVLLFHSDTAKSRSSPPSGFVYEKLKPINFVLNNEEHSVNLALSSNHYKYDNVWNQGSFQIRNLLRKKIINFFLAQEAHINKLQEIHNNDSWNFADYVICVDNLAHDYLQFGVIDKSANLYSSLSELLQLRVSCWKKQKRRPHWFKDIVERSKHKWPSISMSQHPKRFTTDVIDNSTYQELRGIFTASQIYTLKDSSRRHCDLEHCVLQFLSSVGRELNTLSIDLPRGAFLCWKHVNALEIIGLLDEITGPPSLIGRLYAVTQDTLMQLGKIVELFAFNAKQTVESVDLVLSMTCGMDHSDHHVTSLSLRQALSSKDAFDNRVIHLSEMAISTLKHASYHRQAQSCSLVLAEYLFQNDEPLRAYKCFITAVATFRGWNKLLRDAHVRFLPHMESVNEPAILPHAAYAAVECHNLDLWNFFKKTVIEVGEGEELVIANLDLLFTVHPLVVSDFPSINWPLTVTVNLTPKILSSIDVTKASLKMCRVDSSSMHYYYTPSLYCHLESEGRILFASSDSVLSIGSENSTIGFLKEYAPAHVTLCSTITPGTIFPDKGFNLLFTFETDQVGVYFVQSIDIVIGCINFRAPLKTWVIVNDYTPTVCTDVDSFVASGRDYECVFKFSTPLNMDVKELSITSDAETLITSYYLDKAQSQVSVNLKPQISTFASIVCSLCLLFHFAKNCCASTNVKLTILPPLSISFRRFLSGRFFGFLKNTSTESLNSLTIATLDHSVTSPVTLLPDDIYTLAVNPTSNDISVSFSCSGETIRMHHTIDLEGYSHNCCIDVCVLSKPPFLLNKPLSVEIKMIGNDEMESLRLEINLNEEDEHNWVVLGSRRAKIILNKPHVISFVPLTVGIIKLPRYLFYASESSDLIWPTVIQEESIVITPPETFNANLALLTEQ